MQELIDPTEQVHMGDRYYPPDELQQMSVVQRSHLEELEQTKMRLLFEKQRKK